LVSINLPDSFVGTQLPPGARRDDYTEEEARNIEHVIALRFVPIPERPGFHHPDAKHNRSGIKTIAQRATEQGREGTWVSGLSDRKDEFIDIIAKGDRVWTSFLARGYHTGEMYGFPPTGKQLTLHEFGFYRFHPDGRIIEAYYLGEELELLEQLRGQVVLSTQEG
jgi:hypothetical protein